MILVINSLISDGVCSHCTNTRAFCSNCLLQALQMSYDSVLPEIITCCESYVQMQHVCKGQNVYVFAVELHFLVG